MSHQILDPVAFFERLADLHDVRIETVTWFPKRLLMMIDDLYSGFLDLPEYRGPLRATLEFESPRQLSLNTVDASRLSILALTVRQLEAGALAVTVDLSPDGHIQIECKAIRGDFDPAVVLADVQSDGVLPAG